MYEQRSATTRDGRRLTYSVVGEGPILVCHPGGPGFDGRYFEGLAGLESERTVVLVDPAGTGSSDPWTEDAYSLERRADDVDDLRVALGEERIDLLGHSAGGFVGMRYAVLYPQRVRKLLLVGSLARFTDDLRGAIAAQAQLHAHEPWFADAQTAFVRRVAGDYADAVEFNALYMLGSRFHFARYAEAERSFLERLEEAGSRIDLRTLDSFNDQVASFDLRPDLRRIEAETLIVNGELEAQRSAEGELLDGIDNACLAIVGGAGHFPWIEQPERFRDAVLPFLSS